MAENTWCYRKNKYERGIVNVFRNSEARRCKSNVQRIG